MTLKKLCFIGAAVVSFITFLMYLFSKIGNVSAFILSFDVSYIDAIFGKEVTLSFVETTTSKVFEFSFMNLIGMILMILSIAYSIILALDIRFFKSRIDSIVASSLHLVSGIMAVLALDFIVLASGESIKEYFISSGMPVIILILSIVVAVITLITEFFVPKTKIQFAN